MTKYREISAKKSWDSVGETLHEIVACPETQSPRS